MNNKKREYAKLLLKCIKLEEKDYLFIRISSFLEEFINILEEEAKNYNLKDIYIEREDVFKKHDILFKCHQEDINKHPLFDHSIYNKYAKLDAAFLFIQSMVPNLMDDIDPKKIKETTKHVRSTEEEFRSLYETDKLNWCIAGVPNSYWASNGLKMSEDELWELIFKVTLIDGKSDAYNNWQEKFKKLDKITDKLNKYDFDYLHYENKKGTDLKVYLPNGHIWANGKDKKGLICNLPTEEIFTSPDFRKTEGVVVSARPLYYNNIMIDEFKLTFKKGQVVDIDAKEGLDILKGIVENDPNSAYLGECALVSYNSPISNTGIIFKETLYDENASCHLALGSGFNECNKYASDYRGDDLRNIGVNDALIHVDFMIGTPDLKITGVKKSGEEVVIMEEGNLII